MLGGERDEEVAILTHAFEFESKCQAYIRPPDLMPNGALAVEKVQRRVFFSSLSIGRYI